MRTAITILAVACLCACTTPKQAEKHIDHRIYSAPEAKVKIAEMKERLAIIEEENRESLALRKKAKDRWEQVQEKVKTRYGANLRRASNYELQSLIDWISQEIWEGSPPESIYTLIDARREFKNTDQAIHTAMLFLAREEQARRASENAKEESQ